MIRVAFQRTARRAFTSASVRRAVSVMDMPAMSPTMDAGGIVEWKVKAGQPFSAGDVLLDVETDKAQISVEAQDDGILARIVENDGAKDIAVGRPIAVLAEEGDDLSAINYESLLASSSPKESAKEAPKDTSPKPAGNSTSSSATSKPVESGAKQPSKPPSGQLLPSVIRLLHANHISEAQLAEVDGSGPNGRITKGDVLAYLGKIAKTSPKDEQQRLEKLSHMNPGKIELAPKAAPKVDEASQAGAAVPKKSEIEVLTEEVSLEGVPLSASKAKVSEAKRLALRQVLLGAQPRPSILRDPVFEYLAGPTKLPFEVNVGLVKVLRAKPVAVPVSISYTSSGKKAAHEFLVNFKQALASPPTDA